MKEIGLTNNDITEIGIFVRKINQKEQKVGSRDHINNDAGNLRKLNQIIGKVGEVAAAKFTGGNIDFTIWDTGSRGSDQFEPDIQNPTGNFSGKNVHVKTTSNLEWGWTIDRADPLIQKPDPDDVYVFMFYNGKGKPQLVGWVEASTLVGKYKPTKKLKHKVALYYPDIKNYLKLS